MQWKNTCKFWSFPYLNLMRRNDSFFQINVSKTNVSMWKELNVMDMNDMRSDKLKNFRTHIAGNSNSFPCNGYYSYTKEN